MKNLLIIAHTPSPNTQQLAEALLAGCLAAEEDELEIQLRSPFATKPEHILAAHGLILFTPENFAYMSGAMKDCFDRCYYPCLEQTQGLPYSLVIRAGSDGTGTEQAIQRITTGLRWRKVQPTLICRGTFQTEFIAECHAIGLVMAAGLALGVF